MDVLLAPENYPAIGIAVLVVVITIIFLSTRGPAIALKKDEFQKWPLIAKEMISHDTGKYTFGFPSSTMKLGLPIGQHITLRFTDETGKSHQRSYTPVTGDETIGQVSFVVKVYRANVHPKFPNGGKLSQHLDSLKIGDTIDVKGPKGHLTWLGEGQFTIAAMRKPLEKRFVSHLNMIAGGTGITPMLQILTAIFSNPNDKTCVKMIFANQTEDDILVRKELEEIASKYPDRFQLHYTLDRPPAGWKYSTGFVTKEMMEQNLFNANGKATQTYLCGPPPMLKYACFPNLEAMGFTEKEWFAF